MQNFLDTTFNDLFEDPAWSTNWSAASDQNVTSRISTTQTIETSSNANYIGYRKLAKAYTMLADLGVEGLNKNAFDAIVDKAMTIVGEAVQDLAVEQSRLGTAQQRITTANDRMGAETDILTKQINAMEAVDPYDASTRVTTLLTQMETAYSLTARIQKLTLLNYL
jgi:flagellar hook-associated protein 3 FlgL